MAVMFLVLLLQTVVRLLLCQSFDQLEQCSSLSTCNRRNENESGIPNCTNSSGECSCASRTCWRINGACVHACRETALTECTACLQTSYCAMCRIQCGALCLDPTCQYSLNKTDCQTCAPGLYGPKCNLSCSPVCRDSCYEETGYCRRCEPRKHGPECQETCPELCSACSSQNGSCLECLEGYTGRHCDIICPEGFHGARCANTCSEYCATESCDHVTGYCVGGCRPGYFGPSCLKKCPTGTYGQDCAAECSLTCANDGKCHHVNGSCMHGCSSGFHGNQCDMLCSMGTHGENCSKECSSYCFFGVCNRFSGHCQRCVPGRDGVFCENTTTGRYMLADRNEDTLSIDQTILIFLVLLTVGAGSWTFLGICVYYRQKIFKEELERTGKFPRKWKSIIRKYPEYFIHPKLQEGASVLCRRSSGHKRMRRRQRRRFGRRGRAHKPADSYRRLFEQGIHTCFRFQIEELAKQYTQKIIAKGMQSASYATDVWTGHDEAIKMGDRGHIREGVLNRQEEEQILKVREDTFHVLNETSVGGHVVRDVLKCVGQAAHRVPLAERSNHESGDNPESNEGTKSNESMQCDGSESNAGTQFSEVNHRKRFNEIAEETSQHAKCTLAKLENTRQGLVLDIEMLSDTAQREKSYSDIALGEKSYSGIALGDTRRSHTEHIKASNVDVVNGQDRCMDITQGELGFSGIHQTEKPSFNTRQEDGISSGHTLLDIEHTNVRSVSWSASDKQCLCSVLECRGSVITTDDAQEETFVPVLTAEEISQNMQKDHRRETSIVSLHEGSGKAVSSSDLNLVCEFTRDTSRDKEDDTMECLRPTTPTNSLYRQRASRLRRTRHSQKHTLQDAREVTSLTIHSEVQSSSGKTVPPSESSAKKTSRRRSRSSTTADTDSSCSESASSTVVSSLATSLTGTNTDSVLSARLQLSTNQQANLQAALHRQSQPSTARTDYLQNRYYHSDTGRPSTVTQGGYDARKNLENDSSDAGHSTEQNVFQRSYRNLVSIVNLILRPNRQQSEDMSLKRDTPAPSNPTVPEWPTTGQFLIHRLETWRRWRNIQSEIMEKRNLRLAQHSSVFGRGFTAGRNVTSSPGTNTLRTSAKVKEASSLSDLSQVSASKSASSRGVSASTFSRRTPHSASVGLSVSVTSRSSHKTGSTGSITSSESQVKMFESENSWSDDDSSSAVTRSTVHYPRPYVPKYSLESSTRSQSDQTARGHR